MRIKRILWASDLSELSLLSGRYAASLARQLDAELHVVHVFEPPLTPDQYITSGDGNNQANPDMEALSACRERLNAVVHTEFAGLSVGTITTVFGEPWQAICEQAKKAAVDLIVLSTHGRTGLKHAVLGSTAERVVQHAPCPVLVVKRPHVVIPASRLGFGDAEERNVNRCARQQQSAIEESTTGKLHSGLSIGTWPVV